MYACSAVLFFWNVGRNTLEHCEEYIFTGKVAEIFESMGDTFQTGFLLASE